MNGARTVANEWSHGCGGDLLIAISKRKCDFMSISHSARSASVFVVGGGERRGAGYGAAAVMSQLQKSISRPATIGNV
jgi:hypothetical protein